MGDLTHVKAAHTRVTGSYTGDTALVCAPDARHLEPAARHVETRHIHPKQPRRRCHLARAAGRSGRGQAREVARPFGRRHVPPELFREPLRVGHVEHDFLPAPRGSSRKAPHAQAVDDGRRGHHELKPLALEGLAHQRQRVELLRQGLEERIARGINPQLFQTPLLQLRTGLRKR
jgi:hypothetical protein